MCLVTRARHTSPETLSQLRLRFGEGRAVGGRLALLYHNPIIALSIITIATAAVFCFPPKILRSIKAKLWVAWKKLNVPAYFDVPAELPIALPKKLVDVFSAQQVGQTTAWAVPCLSGRGRGIPANLFGALVAMNEEPRKLLFIARKNGRPFAQSIDLEGMRVAREPKFLSENLNIVPASGKGARYVFIFPRADAAKVELIVEYLRKHLGQDGPVGIDSDLKATATV